MPPPAIPAWSSFVSLNVHEPLTFDGTEICLHPDLLPEAQPGDMIELRIWDSAATSSSSAARRGNGSVVVAIRPRTSPTSGEGTVEAAATAATSATGPHDHPNATAEIPPTTDPIGTSNSNSNSANTSQASDHAEPSPPQTPNNASSDNLPAKSAAELPPVHPRSRANTHDTPGKPPIVVRSKTSNTPRSSNKSRTHLREISDMTIDTVYRAVEATLSNDDDTVPVSSNIAAVADTPQYQLRLSFVMLVQAQTLTSLKGSARTQVSLLRQVADLYQLSSYDMVTVHRIEKSEEEQVLKAVSADFVLVTIKDQFISRGDMLYFQKKLIGCWIYEGQRLSQPGRGIQAAHAREIRHGDVFARSGFITEDTKITFRSRSARIFWLIQMSSEMWDYASPYERQNQESVCQIYFDKFIQFVYKLFSKWKMVEASHSLTVVFFSRTFVGGAPAATGSPSSLVVPPRREDQTEQRDVYGRRYEDHYRVVIENQTKTDWESLVLVMKEAFVRYPIEVGWDLKKGEASRLPSSSSQGSILEAINTTLNLLQFHYLDRDLHRTGNSILVVSAGQGVFEVDKRLASITYQRMMDDGIGSDMLSLGLPPLHIAPFFLYVNMENVNVDGVDQSESYYEVPHWMHLSFVDYNSEDILIGTSGHASKPPKSVVEGADEAGFEVGPNGFIMHQPPKEPSKASDPLSPLLRAANFSAKGNAAASPPKRAKPLNKERQLIAGRDFLDILEACRPRHTGLMAQPLAFILERVEEEEKDDHGDDETAVSGRSGAASKIVEQRNDVSATQRSDSPKEWGALEDIARSLGGSSEQLTRRALSVGDPSELSPSPRASPAFGPLAKSPPVVDDLGRRSDAGPSSPSSHLSNTALGVSYDRIFMSGHSPLHSGLQLQRAPSIDYGLDDEDSLGGGSRSDGSLSSRSLDAGGRYESKQAERAAAGSIDIAQSMDRMMKAYDRNVFAKEDPRSPKDAPRADPAIAHQQSDTSLNMRSSQSSMSASRSSNQIAGGIGAALGTYRPQQDNEMEPGRGVDRSSSGKLFSGPGQGLVQRGISPLLLPPASMNDEFDTDVSGSFGASRGVRDGRFVRPGDVFSTLTRKNSANALGLSRSTSSGNGLGRTFSQGGMQQRSPNESASSSLARSPPRMNLRSTSSSTVMTPSRLSIVSNRSQADVSKQGRPTRQSDNARARSSQSSRRKKAFNPFREQDENEVLAERSHNRRRWSHVFPLGEVEFKRHTGPNWKSLSAPAILPLSIDYFPPQSEIDLKFTFNLYNITIAEFDTAKFSSNKELLAEMIRQRVTQDYQLVPPSHVNASNYRRESLRDDLALRGRGRSDSVFTNDETQNTRFFLSMGHRLAVFSHDLAADTVEVTQYNLKESQEKSVANKFVYYYYGYNPQTGEYSKMTQTFNKYNEMYNWNKVDRIICGDEDTELRDGMRFRRVMFSIIPDSFEDDEGERTYVDKFKRLLEYFEKLRDTKSSEPHSPLNIKIVTSAEASTASKPGTHYSTPGLDRKSMVKFAVELRRGSQEFYEVIEVSVDATFNTVWSFRIMLSWFIAASGKVDQQISLLQRRCNQFGLNLVPVPQLSVAMNVFLNPFQPPTILKVKDRTKATQVDAMIRGLDYVHDGVFYTDAITAVSCEPDRADFHFGKTWSLPPAGRQYLHRSGTLFARVVDDRNGLALVFVIVNRRLVARDESIFRPKLMKAFDELVAALAGLAELASTHSSPGIRHRLSSLSRAISS